MTKTDKPPKRPRKTTKPSARKRARTSLDPSPPPKAGSSEVEKVEHFTAYEQPGVFACWPANRGMWSWGDEVLCGFARAPWTAHPKSSAHSYDAREPMTYANLRSKDGGRSWVFERMMVFRNISRHFKAPTEWTKDCIFASFMEDWRGGQSHYALSYDRGESWNGMFPLLPHHYHSSRTVARGVMARPDLVAVPTGSGQTLVSLQTIEKRTGYGEGRVQEIRSYDGGISWKFGAPVGMIPSEGFRIMPTTVAHPTEPGKLLTCVRRGGFYHEGAPAWIIECYAKIADVSEGYEWIQICHADSGTGKSSAHGLCVVPTPTGCRLVLVYGIRSERIIVCKTSDDFGRSWSPRRLLRDGAEDWDFGYVRCVALPDGKVVACYYWNQPSRKLSSIESTIFTP